MASGAWAMAAALNNMKAYYTVMQDRVILL